MLHMNGRPALLPLVLLNQELLLSSLLVRAVPEVFGHVFKGAQNARV